MNTIALFSAVAAVVGLGGICPQIVTMLKARSSAGQSSAGWSLGVLVNALLAYVNLVGYQSLVLAAGNLLGLVLCATALALVLRYRHAAARRGVAPAHPLATVTPLVDSPHAEARLLELHTHEFNALHGAVLSAGAARAGAPVLQTAGAS